jgi:hypothetical protein
MLYRIAVVMALLSSQALADAYATFGDGTQSCGAFVQAFEREQRNPRYPTSINDRYYIAFISFANGFLSGANMMGQSLGGRGDIGHGSDIEGRKVWLENGCRQHPLSMFTDAVAELVLFLRKR